MKELQESTMKQLEEKKRSLEALQSSNQDLQSALERAWVELAEHKKQHAAAGTKANQAVKEAEIKTREEFQSLLTKQSNEALEKEHALTQTILELRSQITRLTEKAGWREDQLINEIQVSP
jgi:hypothetical protein